MEELSCFRIMLHFSSAPLILQQVSMLTLDPSAYNLMTTKNRKTCLMLHLVSKIVIQVDLT
jgi:hypothetical protein